MRVQDFIAKETEESIESILRQAKGLPPEKLHWSPMDEGRSAMSQLQEIAYLLGMTPAMLTSRQLPEMGPGFREEMIKAREAWDTMEKVEGKLRENLSPVLEAIRSFPDSDLEAEMPFFGPDPWKMVDVLNIHAWNLHYHTGQICYIQTLLGDKAMH